MNAPRDDYDAVPMRPVTDEEIEALPVVNIDDLPRRFGPPTPAADATEERQ